jgi:cell cycle checkpoint protein
LVCFVTLSSKIALTYFFYKGMAFIFAEIFDEYTFHPEPPPVPQIRAQPERATKKSTKDKGKQKQDERDISETESESEDNAKDSDWKNTEDPSQPRRNEDEEESDNTAFEIPTQYSYRVLECLWYRRSEHKHDEHWGKRTWLASR